MITSTVIRGSAAIGTRHGLSTMSWGHAGDGNLHTSFLVTPESRDEHARAEAACEELFDLALTLGGTITGEHGIGSVKVPWLGLELGAAELARQQRLKAVFDPLGIMNPGKVFAAPA